ncbi:MAG: DUF1778 domain-containing protein [Cyclobacteriaceae bacterium]
MNTKTEELARFDAKMPKKQKDFFESAALIGGFRSMTDFFLSAAQEKAELIMKEHNTYLASKKDREIFFEALMHPPKPSARLKAAAKKYKAAIK